MVRLCSAGGWLVVQNFRSGLHQWRNMVVGFCTSSSMAFSCGRCATVIFSRDLRTTKDLQLQFGWNLIFPTVGHRQGWCLIIFGHLYPIEDMKVCCVNQFDHLVTYSELSVLLVSLHFLAFGNLFMFHDFLTGHFGTCCRRALLRLDLQILHFKTPMCPGAMGSRGQSERQWDRNQDLVVVSSSDWFRFMMWFFRRYLIAVDSLTAFAVIINHQTMFLCFAGNRS